MGEEYTYGCQCGHSISLIVGLYNCKGWGDKATRSDIVAGKYGKKAKEALETHRGCNYHFQADIFRCQCGYTKSYDSLLIHDNDVLEPEIFFSTSHRCPRCRKNMERLDHFPRTISCHKCGGTMAIDPRSHMRW